MAEKIRKVIGKATIENEGDIIFDFVRPRLPDGTEVELVALVEPERKLVQPDGAEWNDSGIFPASFDLIAGSTVVAHISTVHADRFFWETRTNRGRDATLEEAKQAAEESLADAGLHGFRWKTEEYRFFIVAWQDTGCCGASPFMDRVHAEKVYANHRNENRNATFHGVTENGDHVLIYRCTKPKEKTNV